MSTTLFPAYDLTLEGTLLRIRREYPCFYAYLCLLKVLIGATLYDNGSVRVLSKSGDLDGSEGSMPLSRCPCLVETTTSNGKRSATLLNQGYPLYVDDERRLFVYREEHQITAGIPFPFEVVVRYSTPKEHGVMCWIPMDTLLGSEIVSLEYKLAISYYVWHYVDIVRDNARGYREYMIKKRGNMSSLSEDEIEEVYRKSRSLVLCPDVVGERSWSNSEDAKTLTDEDIKYITTILIHYHQQTAELYVL